MEIEKEEVKTTEEEVKMEKEKVKTAMKKIEIGKEEVKTPGGKDEMDLGEKSHSILTLQSEHMKKVPRKQ